MKTKKQPVNEQKDTMAMNEHQGWHFIYWDDFGDSQDEVDNQKKDTFADDEQDS
jgi:hypothetical protein